MKLGARLKEARRKQAEREEQIRKFTNPDLMPIYIKMTQKRRDIITAGLFRFVQIQIVAGHVPIKHFDHIADQAWLIACSSGNSNCLDCRTWNEFKSQLLKEDLVPIVTQKDGFVELKVLPIDEQ